MGRGGKPRTALRIEAVSGADLERLQRGWESCYEADPRPSAFLCWAWIRSVLRRDAGSFVLTARPPDRDEPVAFLPFRILPFRRGVAFLGDGESGAYSSLLCRPGWAPRAVPALSAWISRRLPPGQVLRMPRVSDPRIDRFLFAFGSGEFRLRYERTWAYPALDLPATWESYLEDRLTARARYHLRRCLRELEESDGFRVTAPEDAAGLGRHVEILRGLWELRWGEMGRRARREHEGVFRRAWDADCLWLRVFWLDETPITALGAVTDPGRRALYCLTTGYDHRYHRLSPGKAMFGYAIRDAIRNGTRTFDLGRGDDEYKLKRLGARIRLSRTVEVRRLSALGPLARPLYRMRPSAPARPSSNHAFTPGTRVRVRDRAEIESTLDEHGRSGGCRFTRPMVAYCGRELPVLRRVERYHDERRGRTLACRDVYILEGARCDGSGHPAEGSCDRRCFLFWRSEWLEPVGEEGAR